MKFVDPDVEINDTVKLNLKTNKVVDFYKFKVNNVVLCCGGNNIGRVGTIQHISKFAGQSDLVTVKDAKGNQFTTRTNYVMIIGNENTPQISLAKDNGLRKNIIEEMEEMTKKQN